MNCLTLMTNAFSPHLLCVPSTPHFPPSTPPTPRHSTPLQTGTLRAPTANTPEALFELSVLAGQQLPQASRDLGALDAGEADRPIRRLASLRSDEGGCARG